MIGLLNFKQDYTFWLGLIKRILRKGKSSRCMYIVGRGQNITFFLIWKKKKNKYRMGLSSGFSNFLERRETAIGGAGFLDLQS